MNLDVLVAGTGRCGSSFVSMILHKNFNICMGHNLMMMRSEFHRWGTWEHRFKINKKELSCALDMWKRPTEKILAALDVIHPKICTKKLKGIKAPFLCQLSKEQWLTITSRYNTKLVIWPWRPAKAVIRSKDRKGRAADVSATQLHTESTIWVHRGLQYMEEAFYTAPFIVLKIDFTNEVSKEELIKILTPYIEKL